MGVIDLNSSRMTRGAVTSGLSMALDAEMERKRDLQPARNYLGASAIGGECERAIQFEYAGAPREKAFPPATLRKFAFGHLSEEWARQEFRDAGFDIRTTSPRTGLPYGFSQMGGKFRGHPDGVFVGGRETLPNGHNMTYPRLWEHKGVGAKSAKAIERDGLKKAKPGYYAQVALYMGYLDLMAEPAIFTVTCLDSGEQEHYPIPFDADEAQRVSDRAVRIIKATDAEELLPRPFAKSDHYVCTMCAFKDRCWRLAK